MTYLTESVQLPGLELEGRAKKLPSTPLFRRICSASTPWIFGWNHLKFKRKTKHFNQKSRYLTIYHTISYSNFFVNTNDIPSKNDFNIKHELEILLPTDFFVFIQLTTRIILYGSHYQIVVTYAWALICNRSFINVY